MVVKKYLKYLSVVIILIGITTITFFSIKNSKNTFQKIYINHVLETEAYAYLPEEAKNYIKEIYEETGEVVLTEKNKEENIPYLNPLYVSYLQLSDESKNNESIIPSQTIIDYSSVDDTVNDTLPTAYDLRDVSGKNYVTPVRNQGNFGICWAFASAGAVESYILKTNDESYTSQSTLISERQIDYATSSDGISDYQSEYVSFVDRELGSGGNFYISTIAMASGISLINYNNFKEYNSYDLSQMELSEILNYGNSLYEINSTIIMPSLKLRESTNSLTTSQINTRNSYINKIKENIMTNGATYVSTYMDSSCKYFDSNLSNTVIDVYNCNISGGHAMEIIGWDDDAEYSYCASTSVHKASTSGCTNIVTGKGVWILKNSWGSNTQYPYLTYDSLYTGVNFITDMDLTSDKSWDNDYILGSESETMTNGTYNFSDTLIKNTEQVKKIKFITNATDGTYTIKIKKSDNSYVTYSKTVELPGLVTFEFTDEIEVNENSSFTISSSSYYIDKVIVFTKNVDTNMYIDLDSYTNMVLEDQSIRLYSNTKNIASNTTLVYKVYNEDDEDVTSNVTFTNNVVAENNVNTLMSISNNLISGNYTLKVYCDNQLINTVEFTFLKMSGSGTQADPYIITNPTELYQIRNDLDAYYELGNDIDLSSITSSGGKYYNKVDKCNEGFGWEPISNFEGTLDGKGYTIKGLNQKTYITCQADNNNYYYTSNMGSGLFNLTTGNVNIKNLILEDFNISCHGNCGALVSNYTNTTSDSIEQTANFENIAITNSNILGISASSAYAYVGSLFGNLITLDNININNIYIDASIKNESSGTMGYLMHYVQGKNVNISNIQMIGNLTGKYTDGSQSGVITKNIILTSGHNYNFNNILSTIYDENTMYFISSSASSYYTLTNSNILKIPDHDSNKFLDGSYSGVNVYDKDEDILELTKSENYSTWTNLDNYWEFKTVDNIPRFPVLKLVNFKYTSVGDITVNYEDTVLKNIYDYITPNTDAAKRINYKIDDETIATIDSDGNITPLATGSTSVHIESMYDGYIKDVPLTVNAKYYTVKFDSNGGLGTMDNQNIILSKATKLSKNTFTKEGYIFNGWNTQSNGSGTSYTDEQSIKNLANEDEEITLYAQWKSSVTYLLTFNSNGATGIMGKQIYTPEVSQKIKNNTYSKTGYLFNGWNTKQDGSGTSYTNGQEITLTENITLYAMWSPITYKFIFNANGGTGSMDNQILTYDINSNISDNLYQREGYSFTGWNTKQDGSGTSYDNQSQVINLSSKNNDEITLYAQWTINTFNITFNSNGGTGSMNKQTFTYGNAQNITTNSFTKSGYTFVKWNTKQDGTGTSYNDKQSITLTENITLYAIWEESYSYIINNYTYDSNYISGIKEKTTIDTFKSNFTLNSLYTINVVTTSSYIATGSQTQILKNGSLYKEYINIVMADVSGDGKINYLDYVNVYNHIQKVKHPSLNKKLLTGAYLKAADMNNDNKITYLDYVKIYQKIKELKGA